MDLGLDTGFPEDVFELRRRPGPIQMRAGDVGPEREPDELVLPMARPCVARLPGSRRQRGVALLLKRAVGAGVFQIPLADDGEGRIGEEVDSEGFQHRQYGFSLLQGTAGFEPLQGPREARAAVAVGITKQRVEDPLAHDADQVLHDIATEVSEHLLMLPFLWFGGIGQHQIAQIRGAGLSGRKILDVEQVVAPDLIERPFDEELDEGLFDGCWQIPHPGFGDHVDGDRSFPV